MVSLKIENIEGIVHRLVRVGSLDFDIGVYHNNLELMIKRFWDVFMKESYGGNAGYSHSVVNFLFDKKTGRIVYIGNSIHKYENNLEEGTFLCYANFQKRKFSLVGLIIGNKIGDPIILLNNDNLYRILREIPLNRKVLDVLLYTIYQFNMRYECK